MDFNYVWQAWKEKCRIDAGTKATTPLACNTRHQSKMCAATGCAGLEICCCIEHWQAKAKFDSFNSMLHGHGQLMLPGHSTVRNSAAAGA